MTRNVVVGGWILAGATVTASANVAVNQVFDSQGHFRWGWLIGAIALSGAGIWLAVRLNRSLVDEAALEDAGREEVLLDKLAAVVEAVWEPEQARRRLLNPRPLPTTWTTLGPPIADQWANIRADGIDESLNLDGMVDLGHPDAFHQLMTDLRLRGRLVLLGEAGAGKTALLLRAVLSLLATRRSHSNQATPTMPVPVLLRLATWNPEQQTLGEWIAAQLAADYNYRRPIVLKHLTLLLDGLDEMPRHRRRRALQAISATFTDTPLVVTSRTDVYFDALVDGIPMAAAAVVQLSALSAATVASYLQLTTGRPQYWADVFAHDQSGRLAAALSAPLWVDLARTTLADPVVPGSNPAELLYLSAPGAIHAHLLDQFISTAYPDPPQRGPDGRIWRQDDARRWLSSLAIHMQRHKTQDIAWWQLLGAIPRSVRAVAFFASVLTVALATSFVVSHAISPPLVGLIGGLSVGFVFGIARRASPSPQQFRWRRTGGPVWDRIRATLPNFFGGMFVFGIFFGFRFGLAFAYALAFPLAFAIAFVVEFTTLFLDSDADVSAAPDPCGLLRHDRRRTVTTALMIGLALGYGVGVGRASVFVIVFGIASGAAFGLTGNAWGRLMIARVWWRAHDCLPWRAMAFLSDAHRRGVLRQEGGVWQFRHVLLRDRLASFMTDGRHPVGGAHRKEQ